MNLPGRLQIPFYEVSTGFHPFKMNLKKTAATHDRIYICTLCIKEDYLFFSKGLKQSIAK